MKIQNNIIALGMLASLVACGEEKKDKANGNAISADLTKALDCRELEDKASPDTKKKTGSKSSSKSDNTTDEAKSESKDISALVETSDEDSEPSDTEDPEESTEDDELEARHVPADALRFRVKKNETTLCDVMRGKDKKLALFSFTSPSCDDCLERVKSLNDSIREQEAGDDLLSVVIVSEKEDIPTDEWNELKKDHAADAVWAFDKNSSVWKFFAGSKGANKGVQPWVLAMDGYATGFLDKDPDHDLSDVLKQVEDLLGLEISRSETGPDPSLTQTSTSTRTTTSAGTGTTTATGTGIGTSTRTVTSTVTGTGTGTGTATSPVNATTTATATSAATATTTSQLLRD